MTASEQRVKKEFLEILECPICKSAFTDPRMLPCIHTFCFECLKQTAEANQKKPGDKMPCPLCRKDFTTPADGVTGIPRNFFMENLLQYKTTLQLRGDSIVCDICKARDEGKTGQIPMATLRCLECQDNYCDSCIKVHQFHRFSKDHRVEKIILGSEASPMTQYVSVKYCTKHTQKQLDYYCTDCKKIVCVSCFVESHSSHKCKDVTTLDKEFRQTIEKEANKISTLENEMILMRNSQEKRKSDFLKEIGQKEKEILGRNEALKRMIDQNTWTLVNELSVIKLNYLKKMENEIEEIDRCCTILRSFEAYCTELRLKGSAVDICSSVDQLIVRADELERDHETFIGRPHQSVELSFEATDFVDVLQNTNGNLVGNVTETRVAQLSVVDTYVSSAKAEINENFAVVVGINDGSTLSKYIIKINLCRSHEISSEINIPTAMQKEAFAAVYCNTMYVVGLGVKKDEIWKYNVTSGWLKCASLVKGRRKHSAAFVDEVLYICGGIVDSDESVLKSVDAYNTVTDKCTAVGKLMHRVDNSSNCIPFKNSIYFFGGPDTDDKRHYHVQVYNTKENTCSVLSTPMPWPYSLMRAVLWETSAILLGCYTCLIFNFETEIWQERKQFKTDVIYFGLVLDNETLFVIGGGMPVTDNDGKRTWKIRDDVRYVPLQNIVDDKPIAWKSHATLPKPCLVNVFAKCVFNLANTEVVGPNLKEYIQSTAF